MNVELQQLPVFDLSGAQEGTVWVPIVGSQVIDRPHHSTSVKGVKRFMEKRHPDTEIEFSIHPECQTRQHKKGRKEK